MTQETVARFLDIRTRIARAADKAGRDPSGICLVAVTKTFDAEAIAPVLDLGQKVFGENRVQEAKSKWPALRTRYEGVELHLIGPLQSNKCAEAVQLFDVIQSVDRDKIVDLLAAETKRQQRQPSCLVQVNTGLESQKAGVAPADLSAFLARNRMLIPIEGLMCIPPAHDSATKHFQLLASAAHQHQLATLSMGMSSDFETAIACGATHVRVGSAIFGGR
jgi:PLP dependent protein